MIIIKNLIAERQQYGTASETDPLKDELLSHILKDDATANTKSRSKQSRKQRKLQQLQERTRIQEIAFVTDSSFFNDDIKISAIKEKYYITGVYSLGDVYLNDTDKYYVIQLSKYKPTEIRMAVFKDKCQDSEERVFGQGNTLIIADNYKKSWENYISRLEIWINGGRMPKDGDVYEFNVIGELYRDSLLPEKYTKEILSLRENIFSQPFDLLSEVAEIIYPQKNREDRDEPVRVISINDLKYPFDPAAVKEDVKTDTLLQKNDIVIPFTVPELHLVNDQRIIGSVTARDISETAKCYLYPYEGVAQIYAPIDMQIVRCKKIAPEYLYLYLSSDTAIKVINAIYPYKVIHRISNVELGEIPVPASTKPITKYISDCSILTCGNQRIYSHYERVNVYAEKIAALHRGSSAVENILDKELAGKIKAFKEEQLRTFLNEDLDELNICYRHGAYKAAIILAGSILEAVLIDWLSELDNKDYFANDLMIHDKDKNGFTKERRAELFDYIDEIKYIKQPDWAQEADKAHEIRKKRNLVHAKLRMNENVITKETCQKVITYLEDVLRTRGLHSG